MKIISILLTTLLISTTLMAQMKLQFNTTKEAGTTITLPLAAMTGDGVTVDWGDSSSDDYNVAGDQSHTYAAEGTYNVEISQKNGTGKLTQFGNGNTNYSNVRKLVKVTDFGNIGLTSLQGAFHSAHNLEVVPAILEPLITDLAFAFKGSSRSSITNLDLWDVGNVTTLNQTFMSMSNLNQDLGSWDVSNVTNMQYTFSYTYSFNQDISSWDVSKVLNMFYMFNGATAFNQDISGWNVSSVRVMTNMFNGATAFDQDLGSWDMSSVTGTIFMGASAMFTNTALSTPNYNSILTGWSAQVLEPGVTFSGGNAKYSTGAATTARAALETAGWDVTDGGQEAGEITWDGSSSTAWSTDANWDGGSAPTSTSNVIIPSAPANQPVIATTDAITVNNLTIYPGATLTISSAATATGSLITDCATGAATFERYVDEASKAATWHYVSSPVSGQDLDGTWMSNNSILQTGGQYRFYRFDEDTDYWIYYGYTGTEPEDFGDATFVDARGYVVTKNGAGDLSFTGSLSARTNNDVAYAATYTADKGHGFNLVGNPFTSSIGVTTAATSTENFLAENSTILNNSYEALYIWDEASGYDGSNQDYKIIANGAVGSNVRLIQDYIQPGQAFFVRVASAGDIVFNRAMQKHATDAYYKTEKQMWPSIELIAENNELFNSTAIGFNENMSLGLDPSFDVGKMKGNPNIALYTRLIEDNDVDFAIQALPTNNNADYVIPVGIDVLEEAVINFSISIEELAETDIIFEDRENGSFTDLKKDNYSTTVSESGVGRFFLHVGAVTAVENQIANNNIRAYFVDDNLIIENLGNQKGEYQLFDLQGKTLQTGTLTGSEIETKNVNIPIGVYILKTKTNLEYKNIKIVKL